MPYQEFMCPICLGGKTIDIGHEITDEKLPAVRCDICEGKGYLHVEYHLQSFNERTWKRLIGEL